MEYNWEVKDLRLDGKESPEFYKYNDPYVLSVTGYGRTVWIRVDGEMRLYSEDGKRATNAAELEDAGVINEKQLHDCNYDMNPWFDAYEENLPLEDEHLDMVTHSLSEIILRVQNYLKNESKKVHS